MLQVDLYQYQPNQTQDPLVPTKNSIVLLEKPRQKHIG